MGFFFALMCSFKKKRIIAMLKWLLLQYHFKDRAKIIILSHVTYKLEGDPKPVLFVHRKYLGR